MWEDTRNLVTAKRYDFLGQTFFLISYNAIMLHSLYTGNPMNEQVRVYVIHYTGFVKYPKKCKNFQQFCLYKQIWFTKVGRCTNVKQFSNPGNRKPNSWQTNSCLTHTSRVATYNFSRSYSPFCHCKGQYLIPKTILCHLVPRNLQ